MQTRNDHSFRCEIGLQVDWNGKRMRNFCQSKMASSASTRWTWDDEKTDAFLPAVRNYKRQKLGEGIEWDSDKVLLWEHIRKSLGEKWETDFGRFVRALSRSASSAVIS